MAGIRDEVIYGSNVDFSGASLPSGQMTTDGQLLIGSTASPNIKVGTLTGGTGITITNSSGGITIDSDNNGDVSGPGVAVTDNAITRWDGTTGTIIQNSVGILDNAGALSGLTQLNVDNIRIDGNTISSTDTNGNIILAPNGTGINRLLSNSVLQNVNVVGALYHQIYNTNQTAGSYAYHEVRSRPEANGQSFYSATISSTRSYAWGVDDNDSQVYKFTTAVSFADLQSSTEIYRITPSGDITFASTGFMKIPTGTTGQRPGSPVEGMIRANTTNHNIDYYNGTDWQSISSIELLDYQDVTSVADVQFSITGNTRYKVVCFFILPVTNTDTLLMEISNDGGSTWETTGYTGGLNYFAYNSTTYTNLNSTANAPILGPSSNNSDNLASFEMQYNPKSANTKFWFGNSMWTDTTLATSAIGQFGGRFTTGNANAIRFRYSSGNISTVQIALYRYNV